MQMRFHSARGDTHHFAHFIDLVTAQIVQTHRNTLLRRNAWTASSSSTTSVDQVVCAAGLTASKMAARRRMFRRSFSSRRNATRRIQAVDRHTCDLRPMPIGRDEGFLHSIGGLLDSERDTQRTHQPRKLDPKQSFDRIRTSHTNPIHTSRAPKV